MAVTPPTIIMPDTASSPGGESVKEVKNIPARYRSPAQSKLTLTVTQGSQTFNIDMVK